MRKKNSYKIGKIKCTHASFFLGLLYVALQENRLSSPDTCVGSHLVPKGCKAIYSHIITFAQQLFARATIPNSRLMERILYLRLFFFQT